jgi:hypothetical protein
MAKSTAKKARSTSKRKSVARQSPASNSRAGAEPGSDEPVKVQLSDAVMASVDQLQKLSDFRITAGQTTPEQREAIVDQALLMIDQTYVHLPLKRAMHAIDPVQRLKLVKRRLDAYTERAFHNEMISIFVHMRDLHTNYILPAPFSERVAFVPFHIEECFEGPAKQKQRVFVVTEVAGQLSDPDFKPGVVVSHWNGIPIEIAVEINAEREAGSNLDARHLQGLQNMTQRWMGMSLPPDEDWVTVRYLPADGAGAPREARFDWQVLVPSAQASGDGVGGVNLFGDAGRDRADMGIDAKGEVLRRARKLLFAPGAVAAEKKMADLGETARVAAQTFHESLVAAASAGPNVSRHGAAGASAPELGAAGGSSKTAGARPKGATLDGVDLTANSILPDVIKQFGKATTPSGVFGYIRLVTFNVRDVGVFIEEFVRILNLIPQDGLILDVRNNGGGTIAAGEGLLQTMTPKGIEPERFHLINTPLTLLICQKGIMVPGLAQWKESAEESVEIGATFTQGFPLTPRDFCNSIGQVYQGPVVLIVDAGCYSTTDIFSAGFQDHDIGFILGTSGHTGAGGANVWQHTDLEKSLPPTLSPFKPIPGGASFRVAIRRSTRVGLRSGEPLEDLGVVPDEIHLMTRADLLNHNVDLIERAGAILKDRPRQRLTATASKKPGGSLAMTVSTTNIQRIDVLLGGRPIYTRDVADGSISFDIPMPAPLAAGDVGVECRGYRRDDLVVSVRLPS